MKSEKEIKKENNRIKRKLDLLLAEGSTNFSPTTAVICLGQINALNWVLDYPKFSQSEQIKDIQNEENE